MSSKWNCWHGHRAVRDANAMKHGVAAVLRSTLRMLEKLNAMYESLR